MDRKQEPKYDVNAEGRIVNRVSGEVIPDDEPIMIFRARDQHAAKAIAYYQSLCADIAHKVVVGERLRHFYDFASENPERMKEPDSSVTGEIINGE